jgi:hypothetical protein
MLTPSRKIGHIEKRLNGYCSDHSPVAPLNSLQTLEVTDHGPCEIRKARCCARISSLLVFVFFFLWRPSHRVLKRQAQTGQKGFGVRLRLPENQILLLHDHGQDRRSLRLRAKRWPSSEGSADRQRLG